MSHKSTPSARRLKAVESLVQKHFIYNPSPDFCSNQTDQMNFAFAMMHSRHDESPFFDFSEDYEGEEIFAEGIHEGDDLSPLGRSEAQFARNCFRQPELLLLLDEMRATSAQPSSSSARRLHRVLLLQETIVLVMSKYSYFGAAE